MIIVRNLTKKVPEKSILSGISFQADEAECIALIGGSGSGKTTLLRCLQLQEKWDQGQYIYNGRDITKMNPLEKMLLRRKWAYLGDTPTINVNRTAYHNVMAGRLAGLTLLRGIFGRFSSEERIAAMDYLEKVGLLDKAHVKTNLLSGGEKQRVALARALVKGAKFITADEPITGLDPKSAERVMEDFRHICREENVTIICSMNNIELAEKYATRILGLSGGRIVADVTGRRLLQQEKHLILQGS